MYFEFLWIYNNRKNAEITAIMNQIEGNQSNIYKVTKDKKVLLFSYPKPIYWSRFGLVESADHTELDKMFLFFKQPDYLDVFLISLTEPFVFKNLKLPLTLNTMKVTKDYIFAIENGK